MVENKKKNKIKNKKREQEKKIMEKKEAIEMFKNMLGEAFWGRLSRADRRKMIRCYRDHYEWWRF